MDDQNPRTAAEPHDAGARRSVFARAGQGAEFVDLDACDLIGAGAIADIAS
ncbi:hypothetical protein [Labedella phragmitis]|uniref:hypothetical protein n=1 Tax=Labedella phragmitis TaxID=2498849 RepID=UPI001408190F|nr:hypothetical protein [Labedella phragmitis]